MPNRGVLFVFVGWSTATPRKGRSRLSPIVLNQQQEPFKGGRSERLLAPFQGGSTAGDPELERPPAGVAEIIARRHVFIGDAESFGLLDNLEGEAAHLAGVNLSRFDLVARWHLEILPFRSGVHPLEFTGFWTGIDVPSEEIRLFHVKNHQCFTRNNRFRKASFFYVDNLT